VRLLSLLRPFPAEQMESYPVGKAVRNVRNDEPGGCWCLSPHRRALSAPSRRCYRSRNFQNESFFTILPLRNV
jgi:hypothetical protein